MSERIELKRMSEIFHEAPDPKSKEREEKFPGYYTHWCAFKVAFYGASLRDSVVLVHGSQGCIGNVRSYLATYQGQFFGNPFIYSPCTNMGPTDAILGAEEKLRNSLLEVDRMYNPKVITVLLTCCPGVIKEPVEDIITDMKRKLKAKVILVKSEGFTHYCQGIVQSVISRSLCQLFEEPKKKIPKSVNILGISKEVHHPGNFPQDSHELERLLHRIGIGVHSVLPQAATPETFALAPEAQFNTFVCPAWGMEMAKDMKERFGVPHGHRFNPLGITETRHWLMEVTEFFGLEREAEKVLEEEYEAIKDTWEEANNLVKGKVALLDGADPMSFIGRAIALGRMCKDLGMEPIIFNVPAVEIKGHTTHVKGALDQGFDPYIVYSDYAYHRRFNPLKVVEGLGLKLEDVAIYMGDVFPRSIAQWDKPIFDASNSPRIMAAVHCSRWGSRGGDIPGRMTGFRGALAFARNIINSHQRAKRNSRPTLMARIGSL